MEQIIPRYEFRAFAQNFGLVEERIRELSACEMIRESSEVYIVSANTSENNAKIRGDLMDIKSLMRVEEGLEQWTPRLKVEFPLAAEVIQEAIFPAFGLSTPDFQRAEYTVRQYLEEIIRPHPQLTPVHVFKRRFGFAVNACITEIAELLVNGAAIKTVAVESENLETVLQTVETLGLKEYENVNYLLAIKRIISMEPLPD